MSAPHRLPLVALIAAGCVSCSPQTRCTITNNSSETLTRVVISGSSFSSPVPDLAPGATRTVSLAPRGEQGTVSIAFRVRDRDVRHTAPAYYEATGYELRVTVNPDLQVTTEVGVLRPGLSRFLPRRSPGTGERRVTAARVAASLGDPAIVETMEKCGRHGSLPGRL